ncbi:MAG: hypothetical protein EXR92_02485 [Gemmatimonadetes bacterium]|nr:hypothetical protein [Gemmatimonadota bacterium]
MKAPTLAHRFEYVLFSAVMVVVRRLPERAALQLGTFVGWFAGSVLRTRRSVVRENLERAFPTETARWRERVAAAMYRHFGREGAALLRMGSIAQVSARIETEGVEFLRRPIEQGHGVVVLAGHLGNWEVAAAAIVANGFPLDVVVKRQKNPLFDAYVRKTRETLGMRLAYKEEAPRLIFRALRDRHVVALVADQNAAAAGTFVEFFGTPAATARGPAVFAARSGADVVMLLSRRLPGAVSRYSVRFLPIRFEPSEDAVENEARLLRAYHAMLEEAIRAAPEQYFWLHRRWKTRPEGEEPLTVPQVSRRPRTSAGSA